MKTIRRATALLLALLLLAAPGRAAAAAFTDVPASHWAHDSILRASALGFVGGSGKAFGLGRQVTRAEYATMLCRLMGWELISPETGSFDDNRDTSRWYYSAIETAYAHGALLKLGADCGPGEPLPREEMAAMTVRALGYATLAGIVQDDCPFADVATNQGYIALAYRMGFMGGVGAGAFSPRGASTREQAATVLLRVYDRLHATVAQVPVDAMPAGAAAVWAEPIAGARTPVPMNPRAPLESVYAAAVKAGAGGAVVLDAGPYDATRGAAVSREALSELLADGATRVDRSARYGSSYLIHTEAGGSTVVWFESEQDVAEKVQLCRLLGVATVYLA